MMPTHFADEAPIVDYQSCDLSYQGGPVISQVQIVVVYWGEVSAKVKQLAPAIMPAIVSSPYMDALSEYNTKSQKIVRGSFLSAIQITPKSTGRTVMDRDIRSELTAQIQDNKLPAPTYDSGGNVNTLYVLFFPPGTSISDGQGTSCSQGGFCGYHNSTKYNGKTLPYAIIPDMGPGSGCSRGCGKSEEAALGITISHEIAEAVTDVDVGDNNVAWVSQACQGEIGDLCSPGGRGSGAGSGEIDGFTLSYE
jgi:hypothetical protein